MGVLRRVGLSAGDLHLIVPGPLGQRTGGYLYDARIAEGLTALGWAVIVHELEGESPAAGAAVLPICIPATGLRSAC